ncbi:MAG: hypothetical protein RDV48_22025 [Candidatus Eremiobacteraeota bacterium]|nr:hypothetical protein [Candidatus Eremiobacteraeota bacterium]
MEEKKGMKPWVKILLIVLGVLILGCGGVFVIAYKWFGGFMKGFTDEGTKKEITRAICAIDIPEGFSIKGAFDIAGYKVSIIDHGGSGQETMLMRIPETTCSDAQLKKSFDDEKFTDSLLKQGGGARGSRLKR